MSPPKDVHFYFDYGDPRSYLIWWPLIHFCQNQAINLLLHPVMREQCPEYLAEDWSEHVSKLILKNEVEFRAPKKRNFSTRLALQMSLPLACHSAQFVVVERLLNACWRQGQDISNLEVLVTLLDSEGLDGYDIFQQALTSNASRELEKSTQMALASGVRSVPVVMMEGAPLNLIPSCASVQ